MHVEPHAAADEEERDEDAKRNCRRALPVLIALLAWALPAGVARAGTTATTSFSTPGSYTFTVPAGVTSVSVTVPGAVGGGCFSYASGGLGASLTATLPVAPGEQLAVGVGAPGAGCQFGPGPGGTAGGTQRTEVVIR